MNINDFQTSSQNSMLKLFKEGTGTFVTAAGLVTSNSVTIPHGYPTDELIWQVSLHADDTNQTYMTPLYSADGRYSLYADLDSTNLYIHVALSSAGSPFPGITWTYRYRILIP